MLITLIVLLPGKSGAGAEQAEPDGEKVPVSSVQQIIDEFAMSGIPSRQSGRGEIGARGTLRVQDFMLPQEVQRDSSEPYLLRPPLERWREEQVKRYWIPLEDITLDLVRRENDSRIEKLFEDIP